jgi:hypothetical protein
MLGKRLWVDVGINLGLMVMSAILAGINLYSYLWVPGEGTWETLLMTGVQGLILVLIGRLLSLNYQMWKLQKRLGALQGLGGMLWK